MLRQAFEPIFEDVLKWSLIIIGISVGLSILSIFVTVDITQSDLPFLRIFIASVSNFSFFLGIVAIGASLIITFFKRPDSSEKKSSESSFKPKYKKKKKEKKQFSPLKEDNSKNISLFSPRELKLLFSGLIAVLVSIIIWIIYLPLENFLF